MGLHVSHGCFTGPYSQFMRWRIFIAKQIGLPLLMMDGYVHHFVTTAEVETLKVLLGDNRFKEPYYSCICVLDAMADCEGIKWQGNDPLEILLRHSDCDGRIHWYEANKIAMRLLDILKSIDKDVIPGAPASGCYDGMYNCTKRFASGLMKAYKCREDVIFR